MSYYLLSILFLSSLFAGENLRGQLNSPSLDNESIPVIEELDKTSPSDLEILMAYSLRDGRWIYPNPFGHMALRVGDNIYTANAEAIESEGDEIFLGQPLKDYLYGTKERKRAFFLDAYGESFGRHNLALRVRGLSKDQKEAINAEISKISLEWHKNEICFNRDNNNCVDFAERVVKAAGIDADNYGIKKSLNMPRDFFDRHLEYFQRNPQYKVEVAKYEQLNDVEILSDESKKYYEGSRFPISLYRPFDAFKRLFMPNVSQWQEGLVVRKLASKPNLLVFQNFGDTFESNIQKFKKQWTDESKKKNLLYKVERTKIKGGDLNQLELAFNSKSENDASTVLKTFKEKEELRQNLLDFYFNLQFRYIIEKSYKEIDQLVSHLEGHLPSPVIQSLKDKLKKLSSLKSNYEGKEDLFGQAKDHLRHKAFKEFFSYAQLIGKSINKESKFLECEKSELSCAIPGPSYYSMSTMLPNIGTFIWNLMGVKRNKGHTPVNDEFVKIGKKIGNIFNIKTEFTGVPLDYSSPESDEVTVVTPTHVDPLYDMALYSNMGLKDHMVFAAVDLIGPKPLAVHLSRRPEMIAVGRGYPDPIEKTLKQVESGVTHNILIYPQGATGITRENLPIRGKFETGLITKLLESGKKVKIVPVTYNEPANFLGTALDSSDTTVKAHIRKAFSPEFVAFLVKNNALNLAIRASWLDNTVTNKTHLFGQMRTEVLHDLAQKYIGIDSGLLKASTKQQICDLHLAYEKKLIDNDEVSAMHFGEKKD